MLASKSNITKFRETHRFENSASYFLYNSINSRFSLIFLPSVFIPLENQYDYLVSER